LDVSKVGASIACFAGYSLEEAINKLSDMGFQTLEFLGFDGARHSIGILPGFWFGKLTNAEKENLKRAVSPFQNISIHAPFMSEPLVSYNDEIQKVALRQVKNSIDAIAYLGGSVTVIHVNSKPFFPLYECWDEIVNVCRELGDYAAERKVSVAVETGFPAGVEDFIKLIRSINHQAVGAAIDVGHVTSSVAVDLRRTTAGVQKFNDNLIEIISTLGDKVFHFHLHDVRARDWRDHRAAGTGVIDFPRIFACLLDSGYNRLMAFELEEENKEEALLQSKKYIEDTIAEAS